MKRMHKLVLALASSMVGVIPAFANTTQISMNAVADDFLIVQIERTSDNAVVSGDDFQKSSTDPASYEVLGFGNIDARGLSAGSLSSANNLLPGATLDRVLLDSSRNVYSVSNPPSSVAGALYYIKNGYQIRTIRSPGPTGELTTDVDVYNDGDIHTFVDLSSSNTLSAGSNLLSTSLRNPNAGVGLKNLLKGGVPNNTPFSIDLGIYVKNTTAVGIHTTTLTFTGT